MNLHLVQVVLPEQEPLPVVACLLNWQSQVLEPVPLRKAEVVEEGWNSKA